jgi:hypothetical protein
MIGVDIAIFFSKPVKDASGYALTNNNSYFTPYYNEIFILSTK